MKILVTGAQGQVGHELIRQGAALGLEMIATDREELDITDRDAVIAMMEAQHPDCVINAAAYTAVDKAEEEQELAYAINRDGPANLAQGCSEAGIPLLHISTDYLFDGAKSGPYREEDPPNPASVYGKSKLAGDQAVEQTLEQHLTLRVAWVFGAHGHNFARTMLRLAGERDELRVVADQHGAPTWAGDIATALLTIGQRHHKGETIPWGTYHYIGQPATTWHGFATAVCEKALALSMIERMPKVTPITTADFPTPAPRPANSVLACDKITQRLAISQPDWRIGLQHVLEEWKQA
jgi:dTDP-4-dehydrorhamnose reductase